MVLFASQVSQQIYASQMALAQQQQNAQMLSAQMLGAPGMMPMMPMMPQMSFAQATSTGYTGVYGEQLANRLANTGRTAMGIGNLGLGLVGTLSGLPLDPFSAGIAGARVGWGAAGLSGAVAGGALGAAPFLAASQLVGMYSGQFQGGMREQAATNSVLRNNFSFQGGQGAFGRGFSQQQMGQVGMMMAQEMRTSPFTSSAELNQLISTGSEMGMFTAVRDVESFSRRFRSMLDGLRKIQRELGGTLQEALQFTRGTQQLGIFQTGQRTAFASEMRDTMASTGMDQNQLFAVAATGAMLSRATGGVGRQGAFGALRTARQLGAAVATGVINNEVLSEATGGLQGEEAIQAFTARTLQMADRFSRTARGRYSLFALANEQGTGLDENMLDRFRAGDISVGSVMQGAHRRVNRMGRARALNQEGRLRGAMLEEGGMSGQIGMMRLLLGDRALEGGDDLAQLVMQRRMGLSQQESQVWTALMRNQGAIAQQETVDSSLAKRQMREQTDIRVNRSIESFMANFSHGMQDLTGMTAARDMGRRFLTNISSQAERALNQFLGIQGPAMSAVEQQAMTRLGMGMATGADRVRLATLGGRYGSRAQPDPFARSASNELLHDLGFHTADTYGEMMMARGINVRGLPQHAIDREERRRVAALGGQLQDERDITQLRALERDPGTMRRMMLAEMGGGRENIYMRMGGRASAAALDAYIHRNKLAIPEQEFSLAQRRGGDPRSALERGAEAVAAVGSGTIAGAALGSALGPVGTAVGGIIGFAGGVGLATAGLLSTPMSDQDRALDFIARGGHFGEIARQVAEGAGDTRMTPGEAQDYLAAFQGRNAPDAATARSVLESEPFRVGLRELQGTRGAAREAVLRRLRVEAGGFQDERQKRTAQAIIMQAEFNMQGNAGARIGAEFSGGINDEEREREIRRGYSEIGTAYSAMAEAMPEGWLRDQFAGIGQTGYQVGEGKIGGQAGYDETYGKIDTLRDRLVDMSPEDLDRWRTGIGSNAMGRGLLQAVAAQRNAERNLQGQGRGGLRGAAQTAFGMLTGNALGEMEFTIGGRRVEGRNAAQALWRSFAGGGAKSQEASDQLVRQMQDIGVKNAPQLVQQMREAVESHGIDSKEARDVYKRLSKDEDLQRVQREGIERVQRQSDPLGVQRNDLLKGILDGVNKLAGVEGPNQSLPPAQKPG